MWGNKQTLLIVVLLMLVLPSLARQKMNGATGKAHAAKKAAAPVFVKAAFPGGQKALDSFLLVSIHYPENAKEAGVQGRVVVKFLINENGEITDPKITRGIGAGCEEEAKRVVLSMPKWKPAYYSKKLVKMMFTLPLAFKIE